MARKSVHVFVASVTLTVIATFLAVAYLTIVKFLTNIPKSEYLLSPNTTTTKILTNKDYFFAKSITVDFKNGCSVGFLDKIPQNKTYVNSSNTYKIYSYRQYKFKIYLLENSYFKIGLKDQSIKVVVSEPVNIINGWFETLKEGWYNVELLKDVLNTNYTLDLNSSVYDTKNIDMCTKKCATNKKVLLLKSSPSQYVTDSDTFYFTFNKDPQKVCNDLALPFLYFYFVMIIFFTVDIIFCK